MNLFCKPKLTPPEQLNQALYSGNVKTTRRLVKALVKASNNELRANNNTHPEKELPKVVEIFEAKTLCEFITNECKNGVKTFIEGAKLIGNKKFYEEDSFLQGVLDEILTDMKIDDSIKLKVLGIKKEIRIERIKRIDELYKSKTHSTVSTKNFPSCKTVFINEAPTDISKEVKQRLETLGVIVETKSGTHQWLQDCFEVGVGGERLKALCPISNEEVRTAIDKDRSLRQTDLRWSGISRLGLDITDQSIISLISENTKHLDLMLSYSEGGNTLTGKGDDGNPYLIIGQDSIAATRFLFEGILKVKDKKRLDELIKKALVIDYGLNTINDVYIVEQPGEFHLDKRMSIIKGKTVIINDSGLCEKQDGVTSTRLHAIENKYFLEKEVAKQLETFGFTVHKVAGRFQYNQSKFKGDQERMNFFNMVQLTVNGRKKILALGCLKDRDRTGAERDFEEKCKEMLTTAGLDLNEVDIVFLNYEKSKSMLGKSGGASCFVKSIEVNPLE